MLQYIIKRLLQAIPVLLIVSMLSFIIIDLPPGDYLTSKTMELRERGSPQAEEQIENLRKRYGLDKPLHTRDARGTITRVLDMFPSGQQDEIANQLSLGLAYIVCQKLIPRIDGQGRVVAMEILNGK